MIKPTAQDGVTLIEVLVGISIMAVALVSIGFGVNSYVDARARLLDDTKALYLAEEGYEVLRALRDNDWNTIEALPLDTIQYLAVSTTTLAISGSPEIIDTSYRRSFVVRAVSRNGTDDIVANGTSGATVDDGSRQIEMSVAGPNGTTTLSAILTNLHAI